MVQSTERFDHSQRPEGAGDYFIVNTANDGWYVSTVMARHIEATLDRADRWTRFVDVTGSRIRVLSSLIESIQQCTGEQRAAWRAFSKALRKEHKAEKDWGADD